MGLFIFFSGPRFYNFFFSFFLIFVFRAELQVEQRHMIIHPKLSVFCIVLF